MMKGGQYAQLKLNSDTISITRVAFSLGLFSVSAECCEAVFWRQKATELSLIIDLIEVVCIHFRLKRHRHTRNVIKLAMSKQLHFLCSCY